MSFPPPIGATVEYVVRNGLGSIPRWSARIQANTRIVPGGGLDEGLQGRFLCFECGERVSLAMDDTYLDRRRCPRCDAIEGALFEIPPGTYHRRPTRQRTSNEEAIVHRRKRISRLTAIAATLLLAALPATAQTANYIGTFGCSDPEDGVLVPEWSSDVDGDLGSGSPLTFALAAGVQHNISATCIDSGGLSVSDSVLVDVPAANQPPSITDPIDVQPETQASRIEVIPEAALAGNYGLRVTQGSGPAYLVQTHDSDGTALADLDLQHIAVEFLANADRVVIAEGFEVPMAVVVDTDGDRIFEAVVAQEGGERVVFGRVYTASSENGSYTTIRSAMPGAAVLRMVWDRHQPARFRLEVGGQTVGSELIDFAEISTPSRLLWGKVTDTEIGGWLDLDNFRLTELDG